MRLHQLGSWTRAISRVTSRDRRASLLGNSCNQSKNVQDAPLHTHYPRSLKSFRQSLAPATFATQSQMPPANRRIGETKQMKNALVCIARGKVFATWNWLVVAGFLLLALTPAFADSSSVAERSVTKLADGIYVIRHKSAPNGFPQGNTTVVIGERDVFVVDSCYLPSSAREDIAQIRQWTDKPVRYLLNTHWHADHTRGNGTYVETFPSISIISQTATRELIKGNYADHPENAVMIVQRDVGVYRRYLEAGKTDDGTALTEDDKKQLQGILAGTDAVAAEFKGLVPRLPNVTFDRELDLDLGNREVQIKFLGRGNTAGDAVVFVPKEKILVAGDLVVHPGPYMGSGFPTEWSKTLGKMIEMDPQIIVPGHGEILRGTA